MPRLHFTDVVVSRLKTPDTYYDESTPAFGLRVGKNRKTWFVIRGRERLRTNIGQYPQVGLGDARKEAKKLLTEEPVKGDRMTVETAKDLYVATLESKKPRTQRDYKRMLSKYLLPAAGKKKLADVTYDDVEASTKGLPKSEKAHALAVARTFFRWCVKPPRRYIPYSPLEGVSVQTGNKRRRVLDGHELKKVWVAAAAQGYPHGTIVQLLILTGQRRGEIANLRWPWIDAKEKTITLPEVVGAAAGDVLQGRLRQVAVRIQEGDAGAGREVLADEIEQEGTLAGAGLADDVQVPAALFRVERDEAARMMGADAEALAG